MNKLTAEAINNVCSIAIRELVSILEFDGVKSLESPGEFEAIKRGIGLSIGTIDTQLACIVYSQFPELDPTKDVP